MVNHNYPGSLWWDALLDGKPHEIDIREDRRFQHLPALRAACYREADVRHLIVRTHKVNPFVMRVQATGLAERDKFIGMPQTNLRQADPSTLKPLPDSHYRPEPDEPNPYVIRLTPEQAYGRCTCGSVTQEFHTASCAATVSDF
jgi:hypothetical protein